jgi:hypothetical protein
MSDESLRELGRRWRASQDPADELRWHAARVRAGELDPARLELAALLGWPGAGAPPPLGEELLSRLEGGVEDAEGWARLRAASQRMLALPGALDRALVALVEFALPRMLEEGDTFLREHLRAAARELEARLIAPERHWPPAPARTPPPAPRVPWVTWAVLLWEAIRRRLGGELPPEWDALWPGTPALARRLLGRQAAATWGPELRAALRDALAPWVLG